MRREVAITAQRNRCESSIAIVLANTLSNSTGAFELGLLSRRLCTDRTLYLPYPDIQVSNEVYSTLLGTG
jgi:hypothetical protein